jgi:hypothetical protein
MRQRLRGRVRLVVASGAAPRLVEGDWPDLVARGLQHPHFAAAARSGRRAAAIITSESARCPRTPLVLAGHSEGAVAARLALRRLSAPQDRLARRLVTVVLMMGDPLVERMDGVLVVGPGGDRTHGFLAGQGPVLPRWALRSGAVRELCRWGDIFCDTWKQEDPVQQRLWTEEHYDYGWIDSASLGQRLIPSRVRLDVVVGGVSVLSHQDLGLPAVRLTAIRLPAGVAVRRGGHGDVIRGRLRPGRQVLEVLVWRVGAAPRTRTRTRITVVGREPRARAGTVLVSRGLHGRPADGPSWDPLVSGDGDTVLFTSTATNLVREKLPDGAHLFAWDRRTRRTELVGVLPDGSPAIASAGDVSQDGRVLLFTTDADHHWMQDRDSGTTVSVPPGSELTPDGRLVTYANLPQGWRPTGAASEDGRYVALRGPDLGLQPGGYVYRYPVAVWDSVTAAIVHEATISYGMESGAGATSLTDDGGLAFVQWYFKDEISGNVMDMATGELVVPHALDISGDARHVLTRVHWSGITLTDRATGGAVRLVRPHVPPDDELGAWLTTASMTPDASDVAWTHDSDDLLPGVQSQHSQVYLWHDASR